MTFACTSETAAPFYLDLLCDKVHESGCGAMPAALTPIYGDSAAGCRALFSAPPDASLAAAEAGSDGGADSATASDAPLCHVDQAACGAAIAARTCAVVRAELPDDCRCR